MLKSIQWKLVFIYLLLILIAMELISVYLLDSLENYYLNDYRESMKSQSQLVGTLLKRHMDDDDIDREYMDSLIEELGKETEKEIILLDQNGRVITTTGADSELEGKLILEHEITRSLSGNTGTDIRINPQTNYREKYMAMPIEEGQQILGVVYMIGSLEKIDLTMEEVRTILFSGTLIAMLITAILGFMLAKTITDPIKEVTLTAEAMAKGDFDKRIDIKGDDEVGSLGKMFNFLASRLDKTLKEISSEKGKVERILEQMTDGVIVVDDDYNVIHMNPAAKQMLGFINNLMTKEEFLRAQKAIEDKNKETFITSVNDQILKAQVVPYKSQDNSQKGIIIVLNDITEQEELIKMKQEFIENVSHELRTPLTSIKSYVETLLDGAMEDRSNSYRFLNVIENETSRMVSMINDLLVLSRLDKKEDIINFREVEINELVQRSIENIEGMAERKELKLKSDFYPEKLWISGDKNRIIQVLTNVLENAIKYTPAGGSISASTNLNKEGVKIIVEDSGIGIPDSDLNRVFERFYRVDKARSREKGGTGLGLAISREIIKAHGGKIKAYSKEGEGTTIELLFPFKTEKNIRRA
ncbi:ATP-binding protein [Natranaerofaba carboxydovora]|uniref:ATP-binding protein n=1 Tax=Natranaerofaba carboxydovora TaxID=2742683 RepID=UPI001F146121|nr:ATP-binding protein [Natranaerofaba carboxydovora]UMZ75156.1 Sensor histidine kinase WalK [Natranaerofaba carboxydovora]